MSTQLILNLLIDLTPDGLTSHTQYGRFAPFTAPAAGASPLQTSKAWILNQPVNGQNSYSFYSSAHQGSDQTTPSVSVSSGTQVCIRVGPVGGSWPANYSPNNGPLYGWDPDNEATQPHALMITAVFGRHPPHPNGQNPTPSTQTWASPFKAPANPSVIGNVITEVFLASDFDSNGSCTMVLGTPQNVTSGNNVVDRYLFNVGAVIMMNVPGQPGTPATSWYSCGHDPDMDVTM
jgi:hypothetical protein